MGFLNGILGAALALACLAGCSREFDHPFLPGSPDYPGPDWAHDGDGNGVADSVEKYAPGCADAPRECLRLARAKAARAQSDGIPVRSVTVEDMVLVPEDMDDPRQRWQPVIRWDPENASNKGYSLYSADHKVVRVVGDSVQAGRPGETTVTLISDDGARQAVFRVQVCARDLLLLLRCGEYYSFYSLSRQPRHR